MPKPVRITNVVEKWHPSSPVWRMFVLLVLLPRVLTEYVTVTRCGIGPASLENAAEITCNYPWDLSHTHQSFTVNRYTGNGSEKVLVCTWSDGRTLCVKKKGVAEPDAISYQFNTTIPIEENTEFGCDVFPPDQTTEVRRCRYALEMEKVPCPVSAPPATVNTEDKDEEQSSEMAVGFMVVSVILLLPYIALISLCALHRFRANRRNRFMEQQSVNPNNCERISMVSQHTEETTVSPNQTRTANPVWAQKSTQEWSEVTEFCIKARGESSLHDEKESGMLDDGSMLGLEELVKVNKKLDSVNTLLLLRIRLEEQSADGKTTTRYIEIACSKTKGWILVQSKTGSVKHVNAVGAGPYESKNVCGQNF